MKSTLCPCRFHCTPRIACRPRRKPPPSSAQTLPRIISSTMAIIELDSLAKVYRVYQKKEGLWASLRGLVQREHREVHAVRGISMRVEQGEFVAFLGPNGAGKTTTLKM